MSRRYLGAFVAIVGTLFVIVVGSAVAHAQEAAVPTLTSASAGAGAGDDISGGACAAHVSVQIQFDGAVLVTTRSDLTGRYSAHLIIPVSAVPGSHRITVVCAGNSGTQPPTSTAVIVLLPHTGIDAATPTVVALMLLLIGGIFTIAARPRDISFAHQDAPEQ
jgi:LPXTG-motif cell wall-anchored protein